MVYLEPTNSTCANVLCKLCKCIGTRINYKWSQQCDVTAKRQLQFALHQQVYNFQIRVINSFTSFSMVATMNSAATACQHTLSRFRERYDD